MANVKDWVAKIRAAVYGKDVRESIAASIEAMNNECEEAVSGYNEAIENAEQAITQAQTGAAAANSAASVANTAADRANKAAESVEGLDVSQLVQQIQQLTPEFLKVWDCPDGDAKLELWAAAVGGLVAYYAVLNGTFSKDAYNSNIINAAANGDGEMVSLFEADPRFLPELSDTADEAQSASFNGIIGVKNSRTASVNLLVSRAGSACVQGVAADLTGYKTGNLGGVVFLGMCRNQAYQG